MVKKTEAKTTTTMKTEDKKTDDKVSKKLATPSLPANEPVKAAPVKETPVKVKAKAVDTTTKETKETKAVVPKEELKKDDVVVDAAAVDESSAADDLHSLVTMVTTLETTLRDLKAKVKNFQRSYTKELKTHEKALAAASKGKGRRRVRDESKEPRAPSGFAKPTQISPELRSFLKLDGDAPVARTEVTKMITQYIKKHDLQDKENRKHILPDAQLTKILSPLEEKDQAGGYTFFNLQRYMKGHYKPSEKVESQ